MATATFTVTDAAGHAASASVAFTVAPAPTAAFTLSVSSGPAPLATRLTQTCANADHYQITWGDGATGIVHPLSDTWVDHTYAAAGTYTIDLAAWVDGGAPVHATKTVIVATGSNPNKVGQKVGVGYGGVSYPLELAQGPSSATLNADAADMNTLGIGWWRADYPIRTVSPSRGTFSYASVDVWVNAALSHGVQPLPIVYMLPQWMNGSSNDKTQPTNNQDYADWCAVACQHWASIGVKWVELWNEENWGFWLPTPDRARYADLFIRAADAIHQNSSVKVVLGGLSTADTQYQAGQTSLNGYTSPEVGCYSTLDLYGKAGALSHADAVGIHPYFTDYNPGVDAMPWCRWAPGAVGRAIDICDRWAPGRNVQVWCTESAVSRSEVSATTQATRAGMAYDGFNSWLKPYRAPQVPVDRVGPYFWFCLRNRATGDAREDGFGLESQSRTHQPAFATVQTACGKTLT